MTTWTWTAGAGTSDWANSQNWDLGSVPTSTGDVAIGSGSIAPQITTAVPNLKSVTIEEGGLGLTITGNGYLLTTGDPNLSVLSGAALIMKDASVLIDGPSAWWDARGSNAVLGLTDNQQGVLTLANGGKFSVDGLFFGATGGFTGANGGTVNIGAGGMPGILDAGSISANMGGSTAILNFNHTDPDYYFTRDGTSSGDGVVLGNILTQINHIGTGTTTLMGANNITHYYFNESYLPICVATVSAGTLRAGSANAFGSTIAYVVNGGTLDLNGFDVTTYGLSGTGGTVSLGSAALTIDQKANGTYAGTISGSGSLSHTGATLVLTGSNTYTGGTTNVSGTLQSGAAGAFVNNTPYILNGGTLDLNDHDLTMSSLSGSGFGQVDLGSAALTVNQASDTSFYGYILGTGSLTKSGAGTLTLNGPVQHSYSGGTTISAGTLQIGDGGTDTKGSISGNVLNNSALIFNRLGDVSFGGIISGTGSLAKLGAGTLTLTADNLYSGSTTVSAGTLSVTGSIATTSGVTVASGATLGGTGTVAATTIDSGATLASGVVGSNNGVGQLSTGNLTLAGTLTVELGGITAGTQHDQIDVTGTVAINGAVLSVAQINAFAASIGNIFTIIDNDGSDAIAGTFDGLAEGAALTAGGAPFSITYVGGDGNDVVLTRINIAPVITSGNGDMAASDVAENTVAVATVSASDGDGDALTYSLSGGLDQDLFQIDADNGQLSFKTAPDFENPQDQGDTAGNNTYVVEVTASDVNGGTDTQTITITVANANDAPAITSNGGGATAAANAAENQTSVTTVTATDADGGDTLTYSITGGADRDKFSLDASGALTFVAAPDFENPGDADGDNSYVVEVTAADGNGGTATQTLTVTVTDVDETPPSSVGNTGTTTTTVGGATVTTSTVTTSDGRTLDQVTIAPVGGGSSGQGDSPSSADVPLFFSDQSGGTPATTVGLPTGVGIVSTGLRTPESNEAALANLTALLDASSGTANPDQVAGSADFLQNLGTAADRGPLIVASLRLTVAAGQDTPPDQPIVINGSTGTDGNDPLEVLVIDTRNLPPGTVLDLQNIEFAVIIGNNVTLRGGDGANIVYAGTGAQNIVLGADDDELHGGDGDDTVGSKGGNDQLYGDAGNDLVVGGSGDDILYGGSGDDILQGGKSDAGTFHFGLDSQGQLQLQFVPNDADLADSAGVSFTGLWTQTTEGRGHIDPRLALLEQDYGQLETISLLYHAVTGDLPTAGELGAIADLNLDAQALARLAYDFFSNQQQTTRTTNGEVRSLIEAVWGSASDETVQAGADYLDQGGNWADALLYLTQADTHRDMLTDSAGLLQLAQALTLGETGWSADPGDNTLSGGDGDDRLIPGTGNNVVDGGSGIDIVVMVGSVRDYSLGLQTDAAGAVNLVLRNEHTGSSDILSNVELTEIGGQVYGPGTSMPALDLGEFMPLGDFVQLVGTQELKAMGVPSSWL